MIILSMSKNLLLTIVVSFVVFDHVQTRAVDDELTAKQFKGRWYHMGEISTCEDTLTQQCMTHEVDHDDDDGDNTFYYSYIPIHNIPICEYGLPIYTYSMYGEFVGSTINFDGDELYRGISSTVKKYNNGTELIFTDSANTTCGGTTYRLWSRVPKVSAETKAEFEKLATHGAVKYQDWHRCPKLRNEIDDESTLKQIEGIWYAIAKVDNGNFNNNTCITLNFNMNYKNRTFELTETGIRDGISSSFIFKGVFDPVLELKFSIDIHGSNETHPIFAVGCNNGTELMFRQNSTPNQVLLSRNSEVSAETMLEFKKLSNYYKNSNYKIFSQNDCPNTAN